MSSERTSSLQSYSQCFSLHIMHRSHLGTWTLTGLLLGFMYPVSCLWVRGLANRRIIYDDEAIVSIVQDL
jgi:hypothetical protein